MTQRYFGFTDRPFAAAPRVESYFGAESPESALRGAIRCLERAEGIAAVIAAPGMGKTTLLQVIAERLKDDFSIATLTAGHLTTRRSLLQAILHELDYPIHGRDEGDLRLSLLDGLSAPNAAPLLVLCDEAHTLSGKLLEELRLLTNVVRDGEFKVRLLLVGGPALEERLAHPKLEALQQRIAARAYLHPWNRAETRDYVRAQIQRVGGSPERVISTDALEAVFRATDGVPRLINQICDHALVMAEAAGQTAIDKRAIETAWADLQQLPPPTHAAPFGTRSAVETIEFALLDDDVESIRIDEVVDVPTGNSPLDGEIRRVHAETSGAPSPRLFDEPAGVVDAFEEEPEYEFTQESDDSAPFRPRVARTDEHAESDEALADEQYTLDIEADDEIVFDESHLLRRVETIELQLRDLNGDELVFEAPEPPVTHDPFGETFLEEEIVLDPFLDQSLGMFANKPLVVADAPRLVITPEPSTARSIVAPLPAAARVESSHSIELVFSPPTAHETRSIHTHAPAAEPRPTGESTIAVTSREAIQRAPVCATVRRANDACRRRCDRIRRPNRRRRTPSGGTSRVSPTLRQIASRVIATPSRSDTDDIPYGARPASELRRTATRSAARAPRTFFGFAHRYARIGIDRQSGRRFGPRRRVIEGRRTTGDRVSFACGDRGRVANRLDVRTGSNRRAADRGRASTGDFAVEPVRCAGERRRQASRSLHDGRVRT
ncbi:MAG: AAA family ATPase [Pirellulales bacterium]